MGANLADAEVNASMPVIGAFQYLASAPGLEAIGGVGLAGIVDPIVKKGLFGKLLNINLAEAGFMGALKRVGATAVSAAAMWELGRLLGSGNVAKFGAFYVIGKLIESEITAPYVVSKIPGLAGYGLGQARIPDQDELRDLSYLAQARIPDQDELRGEGMGQRIVTEEELLGETGAVGEGGDDEESNVF
jgi:hypothetical protein